MNRYALIGCGKISSLHADNIREKGTLVAVCDINQARANEMAEKYNCKAYLSPEELLLQEKIDIVSIATPTGFHAEHIIKSLQSGKHVVCESPLCLTKAAVCQIIETEKFCRRKLFVIPPVNMPPAIQRLKQLIDGNDLGRIFSFTFNFQKSQLQEYRNSWHGKAFPGGGALYSSFHEYVNLLIELFGEISQVNGMFVQGDGPLATEVEHTGMVTVLMHHGAAGNMHWTINNFDKNSNSIFSIFAEKAFIQLAGDQLDEIFVAEAVDGKILHALQSAVDGTGAIPVHQEFYRQLNNGIEQADLPRAFDALPSVEAIEKIYKAVLPVHG